MTLTTDYLRAGLASKRGRKRELAYLRYQKWTNPATASTTAYMSAGVLGPNTATITVLRAAFDGALGATGLPDFPRNAVVTVTHGSSVVAVSGVISGLDVNDVPITETWSVTAGTTSKTYTGTKAFKVITQITITAASDATGDTIKLGTGAVLGLDTVLSIASAVKETAAGSVVTTGTFVKGQGDRLSATVDMFGTYAPSSAPNGATTYEVWYLVNDPTVGD